MGRPTALLQNAKIVNRGNAFYSPFLKDIYLLVSQLYHKVVPDLFSQRALTLAGPPAI